MTVCTILCCIGYAAASWQDEKEHQVSRIFSYFVCILALLEWYLHFIKGEIVWSAAVISAGFFAVICLFFQKGKIGRADVYMIFSMLVLFSLEGEGAKVLLTESLFFSLAFGSAGFRLLISGRSGVCPLVLHLFGAFLCSRLLIF